ncbi:MAG: hypothetical protein ACRDQ5_26695 [Sciscionella sp.]
MRLARDFLVVLSRTLSVCCRAAEVGFIDAHSALHDVRACVGLLACFIRAAGRPEPMGAAALHIAVGPLAVVAPVRAYPAPGSGRVAAEAPPGQTGRAVAAGARTAASRPVSRPAGRGATGPPPLRRAEQGALGERAVALHLRLDEVVALHRKYLLVLAGAAWADGAVTDVERAGLQQVADLLGFGQHVVDEALRAAQAGRLTGLGVSFCVHASGGQISAVPWNASLVEAQLIRRRRPDHEESSMTTSNSGSRGRTKRRLVQTLVVATIGASAIGLTATPAMAEQRCTGPGRQQRVPVHQPAQQRGIRGHLGIDFHISGQDAQAIIDAPGDPFTAEMIGDDAFSDDHLFTVPLTSLEASSEFGLGARFDRVVPASFLDEDDSFFDRTDEVFGRIKLVDPRNNSTRSFDTPEIIRNF